MATDFLHLETYGRVSRGPGKPKMNIDQVIEEATRDSHSACRHVEAPLDPIILFRGPCDLWDIPKFIDELVAIDEEQTGKKLRDNTQLIVGGVFSYPSPVDDLIADPVCFSNFEKWTLLNLKFLEDEYGDLMLGSLLHFDERFPHGHYFVGPSIFNGKLSAIPHHPGILSNKTFVGQPGEKVKAYKKQMSMLQDRYYEAVGAKMGWDRKSAERPRFNKATYEQFRAAQCGVEAQRKLIREELQNLVPTSGSRPGLTF